MLLLTSSLLATTILSISVARDTVEVVVRFLEEQRRPSKVVAFLCWSEEDTLYFTKKVNDAGFLVSTQRSRSFSEDEDLLSFSPEEHQVYILDGNCSNVDVILGLANRTKLLDYPNRWLILQTCSSNIDFKAYNVYINTRIYTLTNCKNSISINSPYKIGPGLSLLLNNVAEWKDGQFTYFNRLFDNKNRSDLMGMPMNVTVVYIHDSSIDHLGDFRETKKDAISKHNYMLSAHIVEFLNVTANWKFFRAWGDRDPNTTMYTGMLGDLQRGLSEMSGTICFVTKDRIPFLDYIAASTPSRFRFVYKDQPLSVTANIFTLPFSKYVWYASYVIVATIFIVLYTIIKWEWRSSFRRNLEDQRELVRPTLLDVTQMEVGVVFQQGTEGEPRSIAGRIATFVILLSLLFLYTSYCANIVALLQSKTNSIKSLEDLLDSPIKLGVEKNPYSHYFMKRDYGPVHRQIYLKKIAPPNKPDSFISMEEGVRLLRDDFFGFHAEVDAVYKIVNEVYHESEKCGFQEMNYWTGTVDPYVPIIKNSTYRRLIKIGYAKLFERGLQQRSFKRLYSGKPKCNSAANFTSVSLNDCYFAFVALAAGIGVAVLILLVEITAHKYKLHIFSKNLQISQD